MGMRSFFGISGAWIAATLVAVVVAAAAVGSVRSQVTDGPTALGPPTTIDASTTSHDVAPSTAATLPPSPVLTGSTVVAEPTPEPTVPVGVPTTLNETLGSGTAPETSPTTTRPSSPPTTQAPTTTEPESESYRKTYDVTVDGVNAGLVHISVSGDEVSFKGATVAPGWKFELDDDGPEQVKVKFEMIDDDDTEFTFKAEFEDGELEIKISEKD